MNIVLAVALAILMLTFIVFPIRDVLNDDGIHKRDFWVYRKMNDKTVTVKYGFLNKKTKDFKVELRENSNIKQSNVCSYSGEVLFLNDLLIAEVWTVYTPAGSKTIFNKRVTTDTRKVLRKVKKVYWKEFFKSSTNNKLF